MSRFPMKEHPLECLWDMIALPPPGLVHVWVRAAEGVRTPESAKRHNLRSQQDLLDVLARYRDPHLDLQKAEGGKPFLVGGPEFNLSHSGGGTAIAVGRDPVGIDIEVPSRPVTAEAIAEKYFFERELADLLRLPVGARNRHFLTMWTRKEAMTKLTGVGIYDGLREARVEGFGAVVSGRYRDRRVALQDFGDGFGLVGTVATWEPVKLKVFVIC